MADEPSIWGRIGRLAGAAAPILGGMLGGPAGAAMGGAVARALGVPNDPDHIEQALRTDPNAAVKLAELEASLEQAKIQAQRDERLAIEETHQAALNQNDLYTKRTRPKIARQSWLLCVIYTVITIFAQLLGTVFNANRAADVPPVDVSALTFDPVIFGTLAGPALWYMGMRGLDKWKNGSMV